MMHTLLEFKYLFSGYGSAEIIHGISMEVNKGEITTLVGPNGCGKTTLLKSLYGHAKVFSGDILFEGENITHHPSHQVMRIGIGYVPQRENVFTNLTVHENLEMGSFIRKDKDEIANDIEMIYRLFPAIAERKRQKAGILSGGERQLLALGRALMGKPKLLLLDEPTASLSPKMVAELNSMIEEIRERGVTILQAEQNVKRSLKISDRAVVIVSGKKVLEGEAREILQREDLAKIFLGASPTAV